MSRMCCRLVGTLSRPVGLEALKLRHHVRTPCDSIELCGSAFKSLFYGFDDEKEGQATLVR
jgi:hypothetical protein